MIRIEQLSVEQTFRGSVEMIWSDERKKKEKGKGKKVFNEKEEVSCWEDHCQVQTETHWKNRAHSDWDLFAGGALVLLCLDRPQLSSSSVSQTDRQTVPIDLPPRPLTSLIDGSIDSVVVACLLTFKSRVSSVEKQADKQAKLAQAGNL